MQEKILKYLKHTKIDYGKWDQCILNAVNSRIYATTWFLERTATVWDALVYGDYEYVMPLPVRKKWGINYVYQPYFCQQLGIFPPPSLEIQMEFADELVKRFRFMHFQVTPHLAPDAFTQFEFSQRINYILPLHESYSTIALQFKKRAQANIANAYKHGIRVVEALDAIKYIRMNKQQVAFNVDRESFTMLSKLISSGQTAGKGHILAAYTPDNEVCAAAFFLRSGNRLVYLNAFSTAEGKRYNAMYAILNEFIRKNASSGYLLDFEGSTLEGVAHFYKSFSPTEEIYYQLYLNRLPYPFNLLKKYSG